MPPGQPKIYKTPEEKKLANRAKCRCSYHKLKEDTDTGGTVRPCPAGTSRPRIYKTPEEKVLANRAKSKRSYDRRRVAINSRRAIRYRAETTNNRKLLSAIRDRVSADNNPVDIPGWMALVQQTLAKFNAMIRGNIQRYMEKLHQCFLSGVDKNFCKAETIGKAIKEVLSCLEDVLCSIMDGEAEFFRMHKAGQFIPHVIGHATAVINDIQSNGAVQKLATAYLLVGVNVNIVHHERMVVVDASLLFSRKALAAPTGNTLNESANNVVPDADQQASNRSRRRGEQTGCWSHRDSGRGCWNRGQIWIVHGRVGHHIKGDGERMDDVAVGATEVTKGCCNSATWAGAAVVAAEAVAVAAGVGAAPPSAPAAWLLAA
ncbi:hypothetical protein BDN71DRAFT_1430212 [Pleurotus eryngii]|uniref:Uncharacterized protein n=1 Tax=Pleurotus eryngii TaxID=5323 RepID=A0A9P5ZYM8_PLEER|nr:hypothetical protein BDN71DRAFT_1430212 [Pleurotus eryngii]